MTFDDETVTDDATPVAVVVSIANGVAGATASTEDASKTASDDGVASRTKGGEADEEEEEVVKNSASVPHPGSR